MLLLLYHGPYQLWALLTCPRPQLPGLSLGIKSFHSAICVLNRQQQHSPSFLFSCERTILYIAVRERGSHHHKARGVFLHHWTPPPIHTAPHIYRPPFLSTPALVGIIDFLALYISPSAATAAAILWIPYHPIRLIWYPLAIMALCNTSCPQSRL